MGEPRKGKRGYDTGRYDERASLASGVSRVKHHSCARFEQLLQVSLERELAASELDEYIEHETQCPTEEHTPAGYERSLGLPEGAFINGSPEHGLSSSRERVGQILKRLFG